MDLQPPVVDEAQLPELVHEKVEPGSGWMFNFAQVQPKRGAQDLTTNEGCLRTSIQSL